MEELLKQAKAILRGMWEFRWPAVVTAWVVAVVGIIVIFRIPDQYEASARIYVDTQSLLKPLMAGLTVQPNVQQQVSMLSRTLISRPNVEKLVRMADMDLKVATKGEQDALVDRLTKEIQIRNTGRDNLYTMAFKDSDPDKAKRVVQSLVSIFVESSLGATRKDTDSAKTFLNEQIKQLEVKLEEAEARRKEFRIRNIDMSSADGKDAPTRLSEAYRQLEQAKLELKEAENGRDAVKAQIAAAARMPEPTAAGGPASAPEPVAIPVTTPETDARIAAQKRNLDALLQRYTEQHPDVLSARRLIRDLEDQRRKEVEELRKLAAASPSAPALAGGGLLGGGSPATMMAQEMTRMLAAAESQVASLKARVVEYTSRHMAAKEALKTAPQLEAEAAQLNRDYGVIKSNYDALLARRQQAVMSGELDAAAGVADFRLIDPPRVTPRPVAPNRMLLLPGALAASLAVALGIAFLGTQLRPVYFDPHMLRQKTGLPVLGVVSAVMFDAERTKERKQTLAFYGTALTLPALFAVGLAAMAVLGR